MNTDENLLSVTCGASKIQFPIIGCAACEVRKKTPPAPLSPSNRSDRLFRRAGHAFCLALAILLAFVSGTAFADPAVRTNWTAYMQMQTASIGNYILSDFSFDAGSSGLTADDVIAQPDDLGLRFDLNNFKATTQIQGQTSSKSLTIDFKITAPSAATALDSAILNLLLANANNGDAAIRDEVNRLSVSLNGMLGLNQRTDTTNFSPTVTMVMVREVLSIGTGMNQGATSEITQFSAKFTAIPEPNSFALLTGGLAMVTLAVRRPK